MSIGIYRGKSDKKKLVQEYKITALSHQAIRAGYSKKCNCGDEINVGSYYIFSASGLNGEIEYFNSNNTPNCAHFLLDLCKASKLKLHNPIFDDKNEISEQTDNTTPTYATDSIKYTSLNEELYEALSLILFLHNWNPSGRVAKTLSDLHKFSRYDQTRHVVWFNNYYIPSLRKVKPISLLEIINSFKNEIHNLRDYKFTSLSNFIKNHSECKINYINGD